MSGWVVVGISGVTNGGKTTLANKLNKTFPDSVSFHQDKYFYPDDSPKHTKCETIDHNNYDKMSALDMEKMNSDVRNILKTNIVGKKRILILEGFILLNYAPFYELCDLKYQLYLSKEDVIKRRLSRTYDPPDIPGYFEDYVWPAYLKYSKELESKPGIIYLDGNIDHFERVCSDIRKLLNEN